jgi:hypothetical protein
MAEGAEQLPEGVIAEILRAFSGVSREDGVTLHESRVIDARGSDVERAAARQLDTDRRWEDVPERLIEEDDSALCFMDPKGFRYYLPAYMVWSMRNYKRSEDFNSSSLNHPIYSLALSESGRMRRYDLDGFEMFNAAQSRAICRFLHFMARQDGVDLVDVDKARDALAAYWGKFCDEADSSSTPSLEFS